jgi:Ni,Fe-hydrogenase I small subunit
MPVDLGQREKLSLIWLQSGGRGGCTLSLLGAESPGFFQVLDFAGIEFLAHPSLGEATGLGFRELLARLETGGDAPGILCLEGSVMRGPKGTGRFHMLPGTDRPMMSLIEGLARRARYVIAIGTCAAYGGVTAAEDNVTEACGLSFEGVEEGGLLGASFRSGSGLPVINISGCPVHPGWVVETLLQIAGGQFGEDSLDDSGRPRFTQATSSITAAPGTNFTSTRQALTNSASSAG